jgi:ferrous iron transport protein B
VPALPVTARTGEGIPGLLGAIEGVINGDIHTQPRRVGGTPEFQRAVNELVPMIESLAPGVPNARWLAIRLLDGDTRVQQALVNGDLVEMASRQRRADVSFSRKIALEGTQ